MKRKLDQNNAPTVQVPSKAVKTSFDSLNLDSRLLQAIVNEKYSEPTPIQAATIPLALDGKDILARAKTGSGKTAAYVLPILQKILEKRSPSAKENVTSVLILVPTRELAEQVHKTFVALSAFCPREVKSINLTQKVSDAVLHAILADLPDIVVSTPGRVAQFLSSKSLDLAQIEGLVIDEADLVLSYGYQDDIKTISEVLPHGVQTILMSATLTSEVETLKGIFCRNPVVLKVDETEDQVKDVTQYAVKCAEDEKFLLLYVIFKLQLVRGKCIVFVGDIDRSYRLKLYLEQFGIKSCILNSELPINSRLHVVQEFNKGIYDIIIASDEQEIIGGITAQKSPTSDNHLDKVRGEGLQSDLSEEEVGLPQKKKRKSNNKAKDYGVSRGIDFKNVACVLNFDLPQTSKSYTHRIGRTARAGKSGMALSFVVPKEQFGRHKPSSIASAKHDERVLEKIVSHQAKKDKKILPYVFDMTQVEAFRYRMNDALRAVTRVAVREARAQEIKQELLKSEKLKRHFEENPEDLRHLRHDGESRTVRVQGHLKHVPDYLLPLKGRKGISADEIDFVGMGKTSGDRRKKMIRKRGKGKPKAGGRKANPLKSFSARKNK